MTDALPTGDGTVRPLQLYSDSIRASVDRILGALPPESTVAFVAHADFNRASTAVLVKINDQWSFAGYLDKPYHGPLEGGATLTFIA